MHKSIVYFIADEEHHRVKIGTTAAYESRIGKLKLMHGSHLVLLGIMEGDHHIERQMHERFEAFSLGNEWFFLDSSLMAFIAANTHLDFSKVTQEQCGQEIPSGGKIYNTSETAVYLKVSIPTMKRYYTSGLLPGRLLHNRARIFTQEELDEFINENRRPKRGRPFKCEHTAKLRRHFEASR